MYRGGVDRGGVEVFDSLLTLLPAEAGDVTGDGVMSLIIRYGE